MNSLCTGLDFTKHMWEIQLRGGSDLSPALFLRRTSTAIVTGCSFIHSRDHMTLLRLD